MYKYVLLFLFLASTAFGQTTGKQLEFNSAWGVDYESNMVKNPSAAKNRSGTLFASGSLTRDTSAGNKIDNKASFQFDSSALNGYLELDLHTPNDEQTSGNCGFKGLFKGDARLYRAQILDGSSNVLAQTVPLTNETGFREFRVWYPCGASGARKVRITQTEAGTAPAINVGKLFYGRMEPGSGVPPNTFTAFVSSTGAVSRETGADWINGSCTQSSGDFTCNFSSGFFTSTPNCVGSLLESSSIDQTLNRIGADPTAAYIQTKTGAGTGTSIGFTISCTKTGSDYVQPAITPDIPRAPTIQKFTSGSGTYTTPAGVKYIRVRMVGGGSGAQGSGNSGTYSNGGTGGSTIFGTSLLTAYGGSSDSNGGSGGSATINSPAYGTALNGGAGQGQTQAAIPNHAGGMGASSPFGGAGGGGFSCANGNSGRPNTGSGGNGGGGCAGTTFNGAGGSSGGFIDAIISSPSSSYSYSVGAGGTSGSAGTSGYAGGGGGSGYIEVTEYYGTESTPLLLNTVYADTAVKAEKAAGLTSVDYGTYSATVTNSSNATPITSPITCTYIRAGSTVSVSCPTAEGCASAGGTLSAINVTLPISTTQGSTISGVIGTLVSGEVGRVQDSGANLAQMIWNCNQIGSAIRVMNFQYQVP